MAATGRGAGGLGLDLGPGDTTGPTLARPRTTISCRRWSSTSSRARPSPASSRSGDRLRIAAGRAVADTVPAPGPLFRCGGRGSGWWRRESRTRSAGTWSDKEPQVFVSRFHGGISGTTASRLRALAQSIFSHKDDGALSVTFLVDDKDYDGDGWVYPATIEYRADTMAQLATKSGLGFSILDWALFAKKKYDRSLIDGAPIAWNRVVANLRR